MDATGNRYHSLTHELAYFASANYSQSDTSEGTTIGTEFQVGVVEKLLDR